MGAATLALALVLAAWSQSQAGSSRLTASLDSARAFDCDRVCKSIILEFTVRNGSRSFYCIAGEYGSDLIAAHIQVRTASGTIETPVRSAGVVASREPGAVGDAKAMLGSENFLVQPGGQQERRVISKDYFQLEKSPSTLELTLMAYPCDVHELNATSVKVFKLSRPLVIQP